MGSTSPTHRAEYYIVYVIGRGVVYLKKTKKTLQIWSEKGFESEDSMTVVQSLIN